MASAEPTPIAEMTAGVGINPDTTSDSGEGGGGGRGYRPRPSVGRPRVTFSSSRDFAAAFQAQSLDQEGVSAGTATPFGRTLARLVGVYETNARLTSDLPVPRGASVNTYF